MTDTLICAPVIDPGRDRRAKGSIVASCAECERQVWIAPSGQALIAEQAPRVLCIPCGHEAILADPKPDIAPITEEQMRELRGAMDDA